MPMIPKSWLGDYVDVADVATTEDLAEILVRVGLEEEEIHAARVSGPLVVGKVLTLAKEKQSNGKTINYCRVDVGSYNDDPGAGKEPSDIPSRGIICGAHNFIEGDLVVVSLPGAVLPGPFPIASRKTYGHISDGMICSAAELGLEGDASGIIVLTEMFAPEDIPAPGSDVIELLGLGEEVLEINVTPDRGYCFSMRGVAREYAHSTGVPFNDPGLEGNLVDHVPAPTDSGFSVEVRDDAPIRGHVGCDRFVTRVVSGVDPSAPTPRWMAERLEMAGMRPISLAVDVTNYVMLDLGQPMHAYDLACLSAPLIVRRARVGESLETLDEVTRELASEDLLVTDSPQGGEPGARILGLAGVMGGRYSEVEEGTRDILLEAAHFDAVSIARTSRRHRLVSEASKRFERGVDPCLAGVAAQRAVDLLVEYGGGVAEDDVFDLNELADPEPIAFKVGEARRLTGVDYPVERIRELLEMIGCTVTGEDSDDTWQITAPSWRPDLVGPAHLVEEIARLYGYDEIPSLLPQAPSGEGLTDAQLGRRTIASTCAQAGLVEVKSYPFISDAHDRQGLADDDSRRKAVRLRNPLADDTPLLRTSILDSLLDTAARNVSRGMSSASLFEIGMVSHPANTVPAGLPSAQSRPNEEVLETLRRGVPDQPWHLGAVMCGSAVAPGVVARARNVDWADAIEVVRRVAAAVGVRVEVTRAWLPERPESVRGPRMPEPATDPQAVAPWHPGRVGRIFVREGKQMRMIALAGELHPRVIERYGFPKRSVAFELDVDALLSSMASVPLQVRPVSTFPLAKEDIALVVKNDIPVARVEQVIRQAAGAVLEEVSIFDIYEGDQVADGYRSLAFALRLRALDHTLTAEESAEVRKNVVAKAGKLLGAELRS